jgi:hypothetical protein
MISPGLDMTNFQSAGNRRSMNVKLSTTSAENRMNGSYGSGQGIFFLAFFS